MGLVKAAAIALTLAVASTGSAPAAVEVNFVAPENFRDQDFRSPGERESVLGEFDRYLDRLGERYLQGGRTLTIDVLDIRLAGRYEPWQRRFHDVRILRDTTPPRFTVRYTLAEGGKVLISGEETISDASYLRGSELRRAGERFAHEKRMLRDWFRKRFVELRPPA